MNMATLNISSHQIFLFPPSLTLQQGQGGKWKPIRATETAKISHRSKPMDQMTYPQSRHPSLIPDVPPIEEKRVMRCRLLELWHRALHDHSMLLRVKFISRVQGRRDKKGIYTTWIALSWTKQLEHFLCLWQRNIPRNKLYQRKKKSANWSWY